jgi:hypothetical protein
MPHSQRCGSSSALDREEGLHHHLQQQIWRVGDLTMTAMDRTRAGSRWRPRRGTTWSSGASAPGRVGGGERRQITRVSAGRQGAQLASQGAGSGWRWAHQAPRWSRGKRAGDSSAAEYGQSIVNAKHNWQIIRLILVVWLVLEGLIVWCERVRVCSRVGLEKRRSAFYKY